MRCLRRAPVTTAVTAALLALPVLVTPASAAPSTTDGATAGVAPAGDLADATVDVRSAAGAVAPNAAQFAAIRALGPKVQVTLNPRTGTPRSITAGGGYLTGPHDAAAADVARGWLSDNRAAFGLADADVAALTVARDHELPGIGAHVVTFTQVFDGIGAVHGGTLIVAVDSAGRVVRYTGDPVRGGSLLAGFSTTATEALTSVVSALAPGVGYTATPTGQTRAGYQEFGAGPFATVQRVAAVAFPTVDGARPAYSVLFVKSTDEAYDVVVDGATGRTLLRASLVDHDGLVESEGTGYDNFPGAPRGGTATIHSFGPTAASPSGWVDPTGVAGLPGPTTFGNNANSFAQYTAILAPTDQQNRPVSPTSQFNYAYGMNWQRTKGATAPPSYLLDRDPAVTNLFYQHNRIHDEYYGLGFTETAGNFQVNNGGKGGQGGDPVFGLADSGAATGGAPQYLGRDNANMLTLPDGIPGLSSMYLWEPINDAFEGPYADGDFDTSVIQHEYTHGLTTRYTGGGGLGSLGGQQSGSMGEGWSDWYALDYLYRAGLTDKPVVGEYVTGNPTRGIRNWDYDHNPLTYGDFGYDLTGPEVHADGEYWTATLWDLRKALVSRYGATEGSNVAEHLVTDALPLSPAAPSVLDVRDGILAADALRYHGDNTDTIWAVFAKRGAGKSASTVDSNDTDPVPAFDHAAPSRNGTLVGTVTNATTGAAVPGARIMIGEFEARVSPLRSTSATGGFAAPMVTGSYPVTIQARGYGVQTFRGVAVTAGKTTSMSFKLAPNLASAANGATATASSQDAALPASFLIDDTEGTSWKTQDNGVAYNGGGHQYTTVALAAPAKISSVQVSALKPTTLARFAAAKDFTVQVSTDGVLWQTVKTGTFAAQAPRPTAPDLKMQKLTLASPATAKYVRLYLDSVQGETKTFGVTAELEVFGASSAVTPGPVTPDKPVTESGTVATANPAAGLVLLPGTEPYRPGVTTAELTKTCPAKLSTQDVDAHVLTLPSGFADGTHQVTWSSENGGFDLYYFDSKCQYLAGTGELATGGGTQTIPPGSRYVALQSWFAPAADFSITARSAG